MKASHYRVPAGKDIRLADWSTADTDGFDGNKGDAEAVLVDLNQRLADLQGLLYAEAKHQVLVVLQGMDTSGKDGTIKHVFRTINPLGVKVANFKRPNETELAHDYLWRVHAHTPSAATSRSSTGHTTKTSSSCVSTTWFPKAQWTRRYRQIREFERILAEEGTIILKFFLHISKDEQKRRLEARLQNPKKQWKFEHGDIDERKLWDDYQKAYEVALAKTSTDLAPVVHRALGQEVVSQPGHQPGADRHPRRSEDAVPRTRTRAREHRHRLTESTPPNLVRVRSGGCACVRLRCRRRADGHGLAAELLRRRCPRSRAVFPRLRPPLAWRGRCRSGRRARRCPTGP